MSETSKIKKILLIFVALLFASLNLMSLAHGQLTNTSLTVVVSSPPQEMECTVEATLKDENGTPLENMDIRFWVCDTSLIGTNKTDSTGVASLKLTDNPPWFYYPRLNLFEAKKTETYKISAVFEGTTAYAQSSSEDAFVAFVLVDYTPYLVGVGLIAVAIIGIGGYIILRRRKKTVTLPKTTEEK